MKLFAIALAALLPCVAATADAEKGKAFGTPGAPIAIELYSDFQCPSCKLLHDQTLHSLMQDYVTTGKAYLVFREFPLTMHAHSREAANYAVAAARIGKYQEVADALFQRQAAWSVDGKVWDTVAAVLTPAEQKKAQMLAKDPSVLAEVQRDLDSGNLARVTQTPTMIVTHRMKKYPIAGPLNYDLLRRFLDDLLAK